MNHVNHEQRGPMSNQKLIVVLAVSLVALVALIGVLVQTVLQEKEELTAQYDELNNLHTMYAQLDDSYRAALSDLEYYKGGNVEMNAIIDLQKAELTALRNEIADLLKNRGRLSEAKRKITQLKDQATAYLIEIEALEKENRRLISRSEALTLQKEELFQQLKNQNLQNERLTESHAVLVNKNTLLSEVVQLGSVLKVVDVKVKGLRNRDNGKVKETMNAHRVEELNVCFTALANEIAASGLETFFVRILNPKGETLAIEDLGSGMLLLEDGREPIRSTQGAEINYRNQASEVCMNWSPGLAFLPGDYLVEIYNKGHLAGSGDFELK